MSISSSRKKMLDKNSLLEYMIVPSVRIHPHEAYYQSIAKVLNLQILRSSDFFAYAPKCSLIEKVVFRIQAVGLAFLIHFCYDLARMCLNKKLLYLLESCVSKRIAWSNSDSTLASKFDRMLIENVYASLTSKVRLERLLTKGIHKIKAVFVMDENYSPNYCLMQVLHSFNISIFQLQDSGGLNIVHLDPKQRFFGDFVATKMHNKASPSSNSTPLQPHYSYMQVKLMDECIQPISSYALVVYAHAFDDAFHYTLGSLFRDQVDLLQFIASQTVRIGLKLCIKWHPSSFSRSKSFEEKLEKHLSEQYEITFLPPKSTLKSIADASTDGFTILTCYGSIIYEATAAKIPVIACANYSGDYLQICNQPKSKRELLNMLNSLPMMHVSEAQASQAAEILQLRTDSGFAHFPVENSSDPSVEHLFPKFFDYSVYSNEARSLYASEQIKTHCEEFRSLVLNQVANRL